MGSLLDGIASRPAKRTGPLCGVARALQALTTEDQADLQTALTRHYTAKQIAAELVSRGHEIGAFTVERHRRHDCRCPA